MARRHLSDERIYFHFDLKLRVVSVAAVTPGYDPWTFALCFHRKQAERKQNRQIFRIYELYRNVVQVGYYVPILFAAV